jgi:hypothetical protein
VQERRQFPAAGDQLNGPVVTAFVTSAAASGGSRCTNRVPVGSGLSMRSTRNVRQSSRPISRATRYQRYPVWTSRCGSAWRALTSPAWLR